MTKSRIFYLTVIFFLFACHAFAENALRELTPTDDAYVQSILRRLTFNEKVGQLFIVGYEGKGCNAHALKLITEYNVGGIILFERNIEGTFDHTVANDSLVVPTNIAEMVNLLQDASLKKRVGVPLLIAADQENGSARVVEKGLTLLPSAMALAATRSEKYSYLAGQITAKELRAIGINMVLAPVADINSNKDCDIIGVRSFGGEVELVSQMSEKFMEGLHSEGVLSVAKHFPGHGGSSENPHYTLPRVTYNKDQIEHISLKPFECLTKAGVDAIMTTHMEFTELGLGVGVPISLSKEGIQLLLRSKLGFNGVVLTDDLSEMYAVRTFNRNNITVFKMAADSSSDLFLYAHITEKETQNRFSMKNFSEVYEQALLYYRNNPEQLEKSVRKILKLKLKLAENFEEKKNWTVKKTHISKKIRTPESLRVSQEISDQALTLVYDNFKLFSNSAPLKRYAPNDPIGVTVPVFRKDDLSPQLENFGYSNLISHQLRYKKYTDQEVIEEANAIFQLSKHCKILIFGLVKSCHVDILSKLCELKPEIPIIVIAFHEPNLLPSDLIKKITYLCTYSNLEPSNVSVAKALTSDLKPKPRTFLPVSIPQIFDVNIQATKERIESYPPIAEEEQVSVEFQQGIEETNNVYTKRREVSDLQTNLALLLCVLVFSLVALIVIKKYLYPGDSARRDILTFLALVLVLYFCALFVEKLTGDQFQRTVKDILELIPGTKKTG